VANKPDVQNEEELHLYSRACPISSTLFSSAQTLKRVFVILMKLLMINTTKPYDCDGIASVYRPRKVVKDARNPGEIASQRRPGWQQST
jgi:hypothetical protein